MRLDMFRLTIEVNLVGTLNVSRLGRRVRRSVGQVAYTASKAGAVGMTLVIARDLSRDRIRCNTIAPGTFDTPMLALLPEEQRKALGANIPFPSRLGNPSEFGDLACAIVANPDLNGETIRLAGAIRMPPRQRMMLTFIVKIRNHRNGHGDDRLSL